MRCVRESRLRSPRETGNTKQRKYYSVYCTLPVYPDTTYKNYIFSLTERAAAGPLWYSKSAPFVSSLCTCSVQVGVEEVGLRFKSRGPSP